MIFRGIYYKVLHTATILHNGCETDNEGWIVQAENGEMKVLTTSHGGLCEWTRKEAEEKLAEIEASAQSIRKVIRMWPEENL